MCIITTFLDYKKSELPPPPRPLASKKIRFGASLVIAKSEFAPRLDRRLARKKSE